MWEGVIIVILFMKPAVINLVMNEMKRPVQFL